MTAVGINPEELHGFHITKLGVGGLKAPVSSGEFAKDLLKGLGGTRGKLTAHLHVQHVPRNLPPGCGSLSPLFSGFLPVAHTLPFSSCSFVFQRKPLLSAENVGGPQHLGWKLPFCPLKSRPLKDPFLSKMLSCQPL